jgi:mono/diheme cytochrome c family protein
MRLFILGVLSVLVVSLVLGLLLVSSGILSVSALREGGVMDDLLGHVSRRSIAHHAEERANPILDDRTTRAVGLLHYKTNCLPCHGAPGVEGSEFAKGLNPPPPDLTADATQSMSDGELFWVVSNGIRMTGMPAFSPTHDENELWKIVNLVRHLGELTESEATQLAAGEAGQAANHHAEGAEAAEPSDSTEPSQEDDPAEHSHDTGEERD